MKLTGLGLLQRTSGAFQPYLVFNTQSLIKTRMVSDKLLYLLGKPSRREWKNKMIILGPLGSQTVDPTVSHPGQRGKRRACHPMQVGRSALRKEGASYDNQLIRIPLSPILHGWLMRYFMCSCKKVRHRKELRE